MTKIWGGARRNQLFSVGEQAPEVQLRDAPSSIRMQDAIYRHGAGRPFQQLLLACVPF
jgi:hypothetical protein